MPNKENIEELRPLNSVPSLDFAAPYMPPQQNGYIKTRVMAGGRYADCWQKVENGVVVAHVNDAGKEVRLPAEHEAMVLGSGELFFAPNQLHDPSKIGEGKLPPGLFDGEDAPEAPLLPVK